MLADIYVREKLREMGQGFAGSRRLPARALDVPFMIPVTRSIGRLLCRVGERLQWAGTFSERDVQAGCPREPNLHLRRTD
jgi:hypothetical protein